MGGRSNWLPVYSDLTAYFGHWAETPDAETRRGRVDAFYHGAGRPEFRSAFLRSAGIDWVLWGEVGLGGVRGSIRANSRGCTGSVARTMEC